MALSAGTWLGQYEVLAHIGSGARQSRDCKGAATQLSRSIS